MGPILGDGAWLEPCTEAVEIPFGMAAGHPVGILVCGISPRRALDGAYMSFFETVAAHVAKALANARAYEEERGRAEALAEIDRTKTTFFSNVSHEFRTPLTLMLSPLEDMLGRAAPGDTITVERNEIELIHRNGLRLLKLVNALLDFTRIEAGRIQAVYEPVDLAGYTAEIASAFRSAMERAGLRYVVECPTLPEPVYVDRDMWEKIVLNLVSNAFKYTLTGEVSVTMRTAPDRTAAELVVRDTGIGIPERELPRIFQRFRRVEGQRDRSQEGTGFGLALVQELVRLHGGTIRVESRVGRGTEFTVSLPFGAAHLPADRIGAPRTISSTGVPAEAFVEEALRWLPERNRPPTASTSKARPIPNRTPHCRPIGR